MKVSTKEFVKELEFVLRFIEKKTTIPILAHVQLTAGDEKLVMIGTDLEMSGITSIPGEGEIEGDAWTITVPVHFTLKYLKQVEDPILRLNPMVTKTDRVKIVEEEDGEKVVEKVKAAPCKLVILHGENSEFEVEGMSSASFPEIPIPTEIYGELRGLKKSYQRAAIAISKEESRFTLNGAKLELNVDSPSIMVSTDGHRMSYFPVDSTVLKPCKTIIQKNTLFEVSRMNGQDSVLFGMNDTVQLFLGHQRSIVSRIPTGNFPDYGRVLPKEFWRQIGMDSAALAKTIKRVAVCADERSRCAVFYVNDQKMTVEAKTFESGGAKGSVAIEWPDDAAWKAGLNCDYVTDFLTLAPEQVTFCMPEVPENADCVKNAMEFTTEDGWRYLMMPMRI